MKRLDEIQNTKTYVWNNRREMIKVSNTIKFSRYFAGLGVCGKINKNLICMIDIDQCMYTCKLYSEFHLLEYHHT